MTRGHKRKSRRANRYNIIFSNLFFVSAMLLLEGT